MNTPHAEKNSGRATLPWAVLAMAAALLAVRWLYSAITHVTFEDAYISLRYAENLARGLGLVYNPGERVFGASTPLHVLLLAGFTRLGLPALAGVKVLTVLADGATFLLWSRWLLRQTGCLRPVVVFFVLFGLSPFMVQVSVSGMETSFALLLLSWAVLSDLDDRPAPTGLALGLLMLVRPDGALAFTVLLGMRLWRTRRVPWTQGLLALAVVLPWLVIATAYYGTPLPHSIPAKAAAYNLHRPSVLPNLLDSLAQFVPFRWPWGRFLSNWVVLPCLAAGAVRAWRSPGLRSLPVLLLVWGLYLVLPKTLLFNWYWPLLLLPGYVLAALGAHELVSGRLPAGAPPLTPRRQAVALAVLLVGLGGWLGTQAYVGARIQQAELAVRARIGLWLREHTGPDARVALEPIGYIGYFSGRRILDEVGLISPEMVPLNRDGGGWFARMIRTERPEIVVERPGYLLRNRTINSGVPLFRDADELRAFVRDYEPVAHFAELDVPKHLVVDYRFTIYRRRTAREVRDWERRWLATHPRDREAALLRALDGASAVSLSSPPLAALRRR